MTCSRISFNHLLDNYGTEISIHNKEDDNKVNGVWEKEERHNLAKVIIM